MIRYWWLCVEVDEYELPLAVAESARELAEKCGTTKHNVETFVSKNSSGKQNGYRYMKIRRDDE